MQLCQAACLMCASLGDLLHCIHPAACRRAFELAHSTAYLFAGCRPLTGGCRGATACLHVLASAATLGTAPCKEALGQAAGAVRPGCSYAAHPAPQLRWTASPSGGQSTWAI